MAVNAVVKFLKAAKNLANQGMSKEAIEQFARNEFGQINELFQAQIDNLFKQKQGIENIKIKDPDFDDTVVKMQFDDAGVPFNPKDPLKTKTLSYEEAVAREKARAAADEDYIMKIFDPEDFAKGGRAGYQTGNQVMPAVDARMQNTYEQNTKLNQIQRNINERVRKGSKTQGLEIGQLGEMYGRKPTEYNMNYPNLKRNEANLYGAATNMGLRPEQIKAVAYFNTLQKNYGDMGMMSAPLAGPGGVGPMGGGLASFTGVAPGTSPFAIEKFFKTPAEKFAHYQEGLRRSMMLNPNSGIYFDADKTYDAGDYISPKGIYTFNDPDPNERRGMMVDGKEYFSEQDAIEDMGIERYNQFMASGGRAGYYTGGMVDVEPNLSDIGHGSDALMARTRLVSPDGQATTSTGLNYLLAEDNDNIRVPFENGKNFEMYLREREQIERQQKLEQLMREYKDDMNKKKVMEQKQMAAEGGRIGFSKGKLADAARRKFMKAAGTGAAGLAALKTGLLGFGEKAAPVVEKAVETAQGVPPYFLNLVNKIRKMGEFTLASKDKANAYKFKNYIMEEDFAGNIEIIKKGDDIDGNKIEDVYMSYKVDEVPVKKGGSAKVEDYEEFTARPDGEGKMKDIEQGVPDEVVQEGTMFEDDITDFGKASGGIARMIGE
jgi:hypothetical protein